MTVSAIEISGLTKRFGNQIVLDGIDLSVRTGSIFALLGPNGAGKTTLIHILSTLVLPDAGFARIAEHDVVSERDKVRHAISVTGQFAAVDEVLTAQENLYMMGRLSGLTAREARTRTTELLEFFDLRESARKRVKTFSGGMRRRLDLAISLVVPRPVLFLDEPTTGLDTRSRRTLWDIILRLAKQGVTVFLTTQYLEEADQLADVVAVIANGRIVAKGTAEELKSRIAHEVIEIRNEQDEIIHEIPTNGRIDGVKRVLDELSGIVDASARVCVRRPTMDDVFLTLTSTSLEGSAL